VSFHLLRCDITIAYHSLHRPPLFFPRCDPLMRYRSSHYRSSLHRLSHRHITTSFLIAYRLSFANAISRLPIRRPINPRIQRFILISQAHIAIAYRYCLSRKVKPSSLIIAKSPPMRYRYRISQYHLSLFLTPGPSPTRYCDFCSAV